MATSTLTVVCAGGLANRLRVLCSAWAIADATDRRLRMEWPLTPACSTPWPDLFTDDPGVVPAPVPDERTQHRGLHQPPDLLTDAPSGARVSAVTWLVDPTRSERHRQVWERCQEHFCSLTPHPVVRDTVDETARAFRPTTIGVHLRRGDFVRARPDVVVNTEPALTMVDQLLAEHPEAGVFLATDDGAPARFSAPPAEGIVERFSDRYGDRLVHRPASTLDRRDPAAGRDALADLLLLRRADVVVGTWGSSFSMLSTFATDHPLHLVSGATERYRRRAAVLRWTGGARLLRWWGRRRLGREADLTLLWDQYVPAPRRWLAHRVRDISPSTHRRIRSALTRRRQRRGIP